MYIETTKLKNSETATLTAYIHNYSEEMKHNKERPAILVMPGGGYAMVSDRENEPVALSFASQGYNVFVLRYSVNESARNMQPLIEAAESMLYIRENAEKYGVIKDKIAVCGFSAGAHLAGSIGILSARKELLEKFNVSAESIRPNAMILCYPVISSGEFAHRGSFFNLTGYDYDEETNQKYSLERYVDDKTPQAFIWHTCDDNCVPVENSLLLANALQKNKIPFEMHIFDHGVHGLSLCNEEVNSPNPHCSHWLKLCYEWLEHTFKTV